MKTRIISALVSAIVMTSIVRAQDATNASNYPESAEAKIGLTDSRMKMLRENRERIYSEVIASFQARASHISRIQAGQKGDSTTNALRKIKTELWFELLDEITTLQSPKVDKMLFIRPPPPPGYDSGIGPDAVKDPILRRQFIELDRKNKERNQEEEFNSKLKLLDASLTTQAIQYLKSAYFRNVEDATEVHSILSSIKNESRKADLTEKCQDITGAKRP